MATANQIILLFPITVKREIHHFQDFLKEVGEVSENENVEEYISNEIFGVMNFTFSFNETSPHEVVHLDFQPVCKVGSLDTEILCKIFKITAAESIMWDKPFFTQPGAA